MARKHPDDFDLSLTGSQIGSARSSKSQVAKRPSSVTSADGHYQRTSGRGHDQYHPSRESADGRPHGSDIRQTHKGAASSGLAAVADRSSQLAGAALVLPLDLGTGDSSARPSSNRNLSAEFLAFFDETAGGSKPKIKDKNERKAAEHGSRSSGSSSTAAAAAAGATPSSASKKSRASSWYSHSVFRPDSSLSGSAFDGDGSSIPGTPSSTAAVGGSAAAAAAAAARTPSPRFTSSDDDGGMLNNEVDPVVAAAAARVSRLLSQGSDAVIVNSTRAGGSGSGSAPAPLLRASTAAQKALNAANNAVTMKSSAAAGAAASGRNWAGEAGGGSGAAGGGGSSRPAAAARLSLSDMENSYLNIMHKTPVNEIRSTAAAIAAVGASGSASLVRSLSSGPAATAATAASSVPSVSKHAAEEYIRSVNSAASRIQRWYRHCAREKKARRSAEAAMRRLMDEQKERQLQQQQRRLAGDGLGASSAQLEQDGRRRQQLREERARQARLQAIEELRLKREKEKLDVRQKAEDEVAQLKASGRLAQLTGTAGGRVGAAVGVGGKAKTPRGAAAASAAAAASGSRSAGRAAAAVVQEAGSSLDRSTGGSGATKQRGSAAPASQASWADEWADQLGSGMAAGGDVGVDGNQKPQQQQLQQGADGQQTERSALGAASGVSIASSAAATRTTLEDLMSTLKVLEEEERLQPPEGLRPTAWGEDDDDDGNPTASLVADRGGGGGGGLSEERLRRLDAAAAEAAAAAAGASGDQDAAVSRSANLTDAKMRNILSFLDEVDTSNRLEDIETEVEKVTVSFAATALPALVVPSPGDLAQMEQASQAASEVANAVISQRLELEEKTRTLQMLQKALNQQRELTIRHAKETEKEMKKRLSVQKDEYEETIKRHLSFIDQLIDDKKGLTEKCEQLVKDFKQMEKKYVDKIRALEDGHAAELTKTKEVLAASEKLKREKWIEEKTKKIKEMTVKGLEPEIQRLIGKHKSELKQLRAAHEAELLQADERAGQRYVDMTEQLRDQLAKEKELACQREREASAQRYEKQLQAEEEAYQQQRRRLYAEVQEEKERLAQQASRQRADMDKLLRQGEDSQAYAAAASRAEYEKAREEQERRHATELQELKERQAVEREAWEQNVLKKQEAWLAQRERELKEQVRRERDKEIELVIARLEDDAATAREESERAAENKIKRVRDKYESEMAELERSERQAAEKYGEAKAKLVDVGAELERCRALLKQKDHEIDDVKKMSEKLYRERDQVQEVVRQEFADRLVATEEENRRVKQDMAELRSKHKLEIERMKLDVDVAQKSKEEEMEEVHKRVKQAIVKKEEVMAQLKQQYQAAVKRADHLEGLLEQQRKQLLGGGGKK